MIEKDAKEAEIRRKILRITGILGAVVSGLSFLLMLLADDLSILSLLLFIFCVIIIIVTKNNKKG